MPRARDGKISSMIATSSKALQLPASAAAGRGSVVQFDVDEAQAMIREGFVGEDASAELLNGFIVHTDRSAVGGDSTMHSPAHATSVRRLTTLIARIDGSHRHARSQSPIICGERQMPEPDFFVVKGTDTEYTRRLPTAADAYCVIEVADLLLERDRFEKLPIYARSGIPQYIILNLRNRTAEIYEQPSEEAYAVTRIVNESDSIGISLGGDHLAVLVARVVALTASLHLRNIPRRRRQRPPPARDHVPLSPMESSPHFVPSTAATACAGFFLSSSANSTTTSSRL